MAGLKPFRWIPKNIREWTRWMREQESVIAPGTGTVTSVAQTVPTGLSISGSPVTTSGTLAVSFTAGYSIPTTAKQANWDTAFSWGDHPAVVDESADTTCYPLFISSPTSAEGAFAPLTNQAGLKFNPVTGNLSPTLIGGIAPANIPDLSQNNTVTGNWTFDTDNIADFIIHRNGSAGTDDSTICYTNDDGVKGYAGFNDAADWFQFAANGTTVLSTTDSSGNFTATGTVTGTNIGPIADESSDTTCYPLFVTAPTGTTLIPKTNQAGLKFNPVTGNLDPTLIGGIAPANIPDISQNTTVTGNWTFDTDDIADFIIHRNGTTLEATICYTNDDGVKGYAGFADNASFQVYPAGGSSTVLLDVTSAGVLTTEGNIYPTSQATNFVSSARIANWQTAFGWGDHASAGYSTASPQLHVTFLTSGTSSNTSTNQPAGERFIFGQYRHVQILDLSDYTQVRFVMSKAGTTANTGATMQVKYRTGGWNAVHTNYSTIGTSVVQLATDVSARTYATSWINLAAGAIADDVYVCITETGGDGATDPAYGQLSVQFK